MNGWIDVNIELPPIKKVPKADSWEDCYNWSDRVQVKINSHYETALYDHDNKEWSCEKRQGKPDFWRPLVKKES